MTYLLVNWPSRGFVRSSTLLLAALCSQITLVRSSACVSEMITYFRFQVEVSHLEINHLSEAPESGVSQWEVGNHLRSGLKTWNVLEHVHIVNRLRRNIPSCLHAQAKADAALHPKYLFSFAFLSGTDDPFPHCGKEREET